MNVSWIIAGAAALITGIGRSREFFVNLQPLLLSGDVPVPVISWFTTVWFIVSGLFVFSALVYIAIGLCPQKIASKQLAIALTILFICVWLIIAATNIWLVDSPTSRPLIPIGIIIGFSILGIYREHVRALRSDAA